MVNKEKQEKAAAALEELEPILQEVVRQLRMGVADRFAYALVYQLRREVGYVVRDLGAGVPAAPFNQQAQEIIESQIWKSQPKTGD